MASLEMTFINESFFCYLLINFIWETHTQAEAEQRYTDERIATQR
jgi:hypothetical protein